MGDSELPNGNPEDDTSTNEFDGKWFLDVLDESDKSDDSSGEE
jgi:hypothetical protein